MAMTTREADLDPGRVGAVPATKLAEHPPVADREQEDEERDDEGDVVEGEERQAGQPASRRVEDRHHVEVDGARAGHRADPDEDAGDEHPGEAPALHRLLHPAVGATRGHHRWADAGQEHILEHPQGHHERDDHRDAGDEVVAAEPGQEAEQAEADDEVGDEHGADIQGARAEQSPAGLERRGPVARDGVHERQRVGREQDEEREGTRVEAVGDARRENRRNGETAERSGVERDGEDEGAGDEADRDDQGGERDRRPRPAEEQAGCGKRRRRARLRFAHAAGSTTILPCICGLALPPQQLSHQTS